MHILNIFSTLQHLNMSIRKLVKTAFLNILIWKLILLSQYKHKNSQMILFACEKEKRDITESDIFYFYYLIMYL